MGSPDPVLTVLKDFGLNVVRLPRENLGPFTVLVRDGSRMSITGSLEELMKSSIPLPVINADQTAAEISGTSTRELNVKVGVSLLGGWLQALGGGKIGLEAQFKNAATVKFTFEQVLLDTTSAIGIDKFLAKSTLDPDARQHMKLLESDRIYVIVRAAKSKKFSVEATRSDGQSVALDVPVLKQIAGGSVSVAASHSSSTAVTYEGQKSLYFGFEAIQLFYDGSVYRGYEPLDPGKAAVLSAADDIEFEQRVRRVRFSFDAPFVPVDDLNGPT
jgi:hypothetical protein